jgi:hypothetical protein
MRGMCVPSQMLLMSSLSLSLIFHEIFSFLYMDILSTYKYRYVLSLSLYYTLTKRTRRYFYLYSIELCICPWIAVQPNRPFLSLCGCTRDVGRVDCERRQSRDQVAQPPPNTQVRTAESIVAWAPSPAPKVVFSLYTIDSHKKDIKLYTKGGREGNKIGKMEVVVVIYATHLDFSLCAPHLNIFPTLGNFPLECIFFLIFSWRFLNGAQVRLGNLSFGYRLSRSFVPYYHYD